MTIDERIEKLTARHEALTQTVELLTSDVQQLTSDVQQFRNAVDDMRHLIVAEVFDGIARLATVAQSHEQRISRLEEGRV